MRKAKHFISYFFVIIILGLYFSSATIVFNSPKKFSEPQAFTLDIIDTWSTIGDDWARDLKMDSEGNITEIDLSDAENDEEPKPEVDHEKPTNKSKKNK